jgi:hypothetical protein
MVIAVLEKENQEPARMILGLGGSALAVNCELSRAEDVSCFATLDNAVESFSRLDLASNKRRYWSKPQRHERSISTSAQPLWIVCRSIVSV